MRKFTIFLMLAVLIPGLSAACGGSTTGTLRVKVQGPEAVLAGAKVVSNAQPEGQLKVTGLTGSDGFVTFASIKPGKYEFSVSCAGYIQQDFLVVLASGNRETTVMMKRQ